ncbi:50S ribosomal protein L32 [Candidatus Gottesmanbacteria bacterium]|nr:50S ribosomal protein L32 [Candidatus Gottesmanbacteria bacterium]
MAPLPKRRHSTRRGGKRHAAIKLTLTGVVKCPKCGAMKLPHRVCPKCGYYDGRATVAKREKKEK